LNGLLKGSGEVVKHENEKDNPAYAYRLATKKAIFCIYSKDVRTKIWKLLDEEIKKL